MNIVDLIILAILAYGVLAGMYKGMITSGLKLAGFAGAWFGALALYPRIAHFALSNETLVAVLNQYLEPEKAGTCFSDISVIARKVSEIVSGGEAAMSGVLQAVKPNFAFISDAFSNNIRQMAFAEGLKLDSVLDYFTQTLWTSVFNVVAFILAFAVLYLLISIVVNLLDRVISFPLLRRCDWLVGGIFGFLRASVIVVLVLTILPMVTTLIRPELTEQLREGSTLYSFFSQFDLLSVRDTVTRLIMG